MRCEREHVFSIALEQSKELAGKDLDDETISVIEGFAMIKARGTATAAVTKWWREVNGHRDVSDMNADEKKQSRRLQDIVTDAVFPMIRAASFGEFSGLNFEVSRETPY